ncbi:MAG TPA: hypothetical protein VEY50_05285 [Lysobacter sp.]|nr:hypothetical protein [Lysobacter sp.]
MTSSETRKCAVRMMGEPCGRSRCPGVGRTRRWEEWRLRGDERMSWIGAKRVLSAIEARAATPEQRASTGNAGLQAAAGLAQLQ